MSDDTPAPFESDPSFGHPTHGPTDGAMDPTSPTTDPHAWQPPTPEALQARLSGYEVLEFLARGGMGAVYPGIQTSLGRQVAIKILPPQLRDADSQYAQRFKQEARSMAQLNHPGIVAVYDFGEMQDGTLYFVMEFIDGTDVGRMVAEQGRLSSAHAMAVTAHVCDALQYAHEHGVVHRDIKPANIMVGYDGRVKVADFGLAKSVLHQNISLTVSGHVMGTPHFVAPEALTLGMSIDHRADIYAVGVMLYQMLTGKLPQGLFEMPSMQVPGLDPRYDSIVASAMREDREQRYQQILDMRHALDAILTQPVERSQATAQTPPPRTASKAPQQRRPAGPQQRPVAPPPSRRKSHAGWILGIAAVAALAGGLAWWQKKPAVVPATNIGSSHADAGMSMSNYTLPRALFLNASVAEAIDYFTLQTRQLDPKKKGLAFVAGSEVRSSPAKITFSLFDVQLRDAVAIMAMMARLKVSEEDGAVLLESDPGVRPPFESRTPSPRSRRHAALLFPSVPFNDATLEQASEFLRLKTKDLDPHHEVAHIIIDPDLDIRSPRVTLDLVKVTLSEAMRRVCQAVGAESICIGDAYYWQPNKSKTAGTAAAPPPRPQPVVTASLEPTQKPPPPKATAGVPPPAQATREKPFVNSLGMKFVPVPGTRLLMCVHETRRQDYAEHALQVPGVHGQWKTMGYKGIPAGHEDMHPVVGVNWDDANAFCQWLSQKERLNYRLPTDREWSIAAGLQENHTAQTTPEILDHLVLNHFPWGDGKPPSEVSMAGNYVDTSYIEAFKTDPKHLVGIFGQGHTDGFPTTAPVMSFRPNALGLYDMGGNVREWCADWYNAAKQWRVLRGSSWQGFRQEDLLTSGRAHITPQSRLDDCGFRCVLDMAAATNSPPPITAASAQPESLEVKLEFKNAEKYFDVGGYYPTEVPMSSAPPSSISQAPADLASPLYGELRLGAEGRQRRHPIVLNNPKTAKAALFVDGNANGFFAGDASAKWQPGQQSNIVTGEKWDTFQGEFLVELSHTDGVHPARFQVSQNTGPNSTSDSLWIHPQYARVGTVMLGGKPYDALLYDDGGTGDFSAPTSTFRIDLDKRGGFRWEEAEAFPVTEYFTVDGANYQLSGLTPGGESFKIVPSPGWTGKTAPGFSATTITGEAIAMPAGYKGKLLLLHFWSTGQKNSLAELPHLKAVYDKHHSAAFDMLGICVEYRSGKEKLPAFVKENAIAWPQSCEHQSGAMNHPLLKLFKNHSVPNNFLIDADSGKVLACGLRGSDLESAVSKALGERKH